MSTETQNVVQLFTTATVCTTTNTLHDPQTIIEGRTERRSQRITEIWTISAEELLMTMKKKFQHMYINIYISVFRQSCECVAMEVLGNSPIFRKGNVSKHDLKTFQTFPNNCPHCPS